MSLLNPQNFVAPLKNTTHMITLVLVAGLFGSYRYAGGTVSTDPRGGRTSVHDKSAPLDDEDEFFEESEVAPSQSDIERSERRTATQPPKKLLDKMIGRDGKKSAQDESRENLKSTLDDLEKQLGLK